LLSWQAACSADGARFSVIPGPPVVERVLEIAGVAGHLNYSSANGSGSHADGEVG
jgi:hypothetical protein